MNIPIYHYTNANALHSILSSRSLRLTHFNFLNDETELFDGLRDVTAMFKDVLHQVAKKNEEDQLNRFINLIDAAEQLGNTIDKKEELTEIFVASFSGHGDLLSQWRAYGEYSIEFDKQSLSEYLPYSKSLRFDSHKATMNHCAYTEHEKKEKLAECMQHILDVIRDGTERIEDALSNDEPIRPDRVAFELIHRLVITACFFKNLGFSEESEVRIVADFGPMEFEPRNKLIVPYTEFTFGPESIRSITVGPQKDQALAVKSLTTFISHLNKNTGDNKLDIEIRKSDIPYRSL